MELMANNLLIELVNMANYLLLRNVNSLDEGVYICRASNEGGFNEEFVPLFIHSK